MDDVTTPRPRGVVVDSKRAAQLLHVKEDHLRQLVRRGFLTAVGKQGRRATFDLGDVNRLADARRNRHTQA